MPTIIAVRIINTTKHGIHYIVILCAGGFMLYQKKMLILSGEGKGVVLIEKSAQGVRFSLRTFDMPICYGLKAGVITRSAVFVRDLPNTDNPAATFTVDAGDIDELHFAVFDKSLRLYGTNTKRMWEANLMDLLNKHDRKAPVLNSSTAAALPPIAQKPRVLPMPDGTGIPQSRLSIYGDEAISDSDFYTPFDIGSRMSEVDSFLDSPRVLDGLAPRIVPTNVEQPANETTATVERETESADTDEIDEREAEASKTVEADNVAEESTIENEIIENDSEPEEYAQATETRADIYSGESEEQSQAAPVIDQAETETESIMNSQSDSENSSPSAIKEQEQTHAEAAAVSTGAERADCAVSGDLPWELTACWLKNRTKRAPIIRKEQVKTVTANEQVKFLRESEFIERVRKDIDALFGNAEKDGALAELLPDIEWVKVGFDGHVISVGRSGNTFLCYAVAGEYEKTSPLGEEAQWLPAKRNVPTGKGYWLIFQNLSNGEIITN